MKRTRDSESDEDFHSDSEDEDDIGADAVSSVSKDPNFKAAIRLANESTSSVKTLDIIKLRRNCQAIKSTGKSIGIMLRRMFKEREVLDGLSGNSLITTFNHLQNLSILLQTLRKNLGANVQIPNAEKLDESLGILPVKACLMSIYKSVNELLEDVGAVESDEVMDCKSEEGVLLVQCDKAVESLTSQFDYASLMTPTKALRTLRETKQRFGSAILEKMGLSGNRISEEVFDRQLRLTFAEFDSDSSGSIDFDELAAAMAKLEIIVTDKVLLKFMEAVDADGNGQVSFEEFKSLAESVLRDHNVFVVRRVRAALRPAPNPADEGLSETPPRPAAAAPAGLRVGRRRSSVARGLASLVHTAIKIILRLEMELALNQIQVILYLRRSLHRPLWPPEPAFEKSPFNDFDFGEKGTGYVKFGWCIDTAANCP
jgi:hypothetical protein